MKTKNIFLTLSLAAFAIGFSDAGDSIFWDTARPIGAILFMLFMIFNLLENESALLDEQNRFGAADRKRSQTPRTISAENLSVQDYPVVDCDSTQRTA